MAQLSTGAPAAGDGGGGGGGGGGSGGGGGGGGSVVHMDAAHDDSGVDSIPTLEDVIKGFILPSGGGN